MTAFTDHELEAYLDDALPSAELARLEAALRIDPALAARLTDIATRRDAGVHSLGAIWRRHRLTCPSRSELGSYLLDVLPPDRRDYIRFHLEEVACRLCQANLDDLRAQQAEPPGASTTRRRKYFQSSAGFLRRR